MIKFDIVTRYLREHLFFWKPVTCFGYLLRVLAFLLLVTIYVLLFCLNSHEDKPVVHTGDVQILLSWSDTNDLDLSCVDPSSEKVYFDNKTVESGGCLDVDMNAKEPYSKTPVENIYWPSGKAPKGKYSVYLTFFKQNETPSSSYKIIVKNNDVVEEYTGTISSGQKDILICSFIVE